MSGTGEDNIKGLLDRCRVELMEGRSQSLLDNRAGGWDPMAGELLLRIGVWCCHDKPDMRPAIHVVHQQLSRLWAAAKTVCFHTQHTNSDSL